MTSQHLNHFPFSFEPFLNYWFSETPLHIISKQQYSLWFDLGAIHAPHWKPNTAKDEEIRNLFQYLLPVLASGKLDSWLSTSKGCLAYVMLADTLPRCISRGKKECYQFETFAVEAVLAGIQKGFDQELLPYQRAFFYMPLTHSENSKHQQLSLENYQRLLNDCKKEVFDYQPTDHNMESFYDGFLYSAKRHHQIIAHFDRFPNRNRAIERISTEEEKQYLQNPWDFFSDENVQ